MRFLNSHFSKVGAIRLDGNQYIGCTFQDCTFVFGGAAPVSFERCTFGPAVRWEFDGPAGLTVAFLRSLWQGGGREVVEGALGEPPAPSGSPRN